MTPRREYNLENTEEHVNVTGSIEHHNYKTNEECAQACEQILGPQHLLVEYFRYHA